MTVIPIERVIINAPFSSLFETQNIEIPPTHSILVKVNMCGICTSEQRVFKGTANKPYPYWGGHELFGCVEKIISKSKFNIGDYVALSLMPRCGVCRYCLAGLDNHCAYVSRPNEFSQGPTGTRGFCNYITVPDERAFLLPVIPNETYIFVEPTACVLRSIEMAGSIGRNVGVIGTGTFGILHSIVLKQLGYNVILFGLEQIYNQPICSMIDAYINIDDYAEGSMRPQIDAFFCTQYGEKGLVYASNMIERGGTIVLFQSIANEPVVSIDYNKMHYKEIKIHGSIAHTKRNFQDAVSFVSRHNDLYKILSLKTYSKKEHLAAFQESITHKFNRVAISFE